MTFADLLPVLTGEVPCHWSRTLFRDVEEFVQSWEQPIADPDGVVRWRMLTHVRAYPIDDARDRTGFWVVSQSWSRGGTQDVRYLGFADLRLRAGRLDCRYIAEALNPKRFDCPPQLLGLVPDDQPWVSLPWRAAVLGQVRGPVPALGGRTGIP